MDSDIMYLTADIWALAEPGPVWFKPRLLPSISTSGSSSWSSALPSPLQSTEIATGTEWSCPICQDTQNDVASALPCDHQFCLECILKWTRRSPVCPLCSRPVETVRFPGHEEDDYIDMVIRASEESPQTNSQAGAAPFLLDENSPSHAAMPPLSSPQEILSPAEQGAAGPEPVGGLLPEVWAELFLQQQHLPDPVQLCLRQRLEGIYWDWWWLVEDIESCILHSLCIYSPDVEMLVQVLQPLLSEHTVPLIHSISSVIVGQCSQEAQRLLCSGPVRDENLSPMASSSSSSRSSRSSRSSSSRNASNCRRSKSRSSNSWPSSSWEGTPTSSPAASKVKKKPGISASTSTGSPSCSSPAPNPTEWDQSQERLQQPVVAGPSAQGCSHSPSALSQGKKLLRKGSQDPPKKRVPSSQDSPPPSRSLL